MQRQKTHTNNQKYYSRIIKSYQQNAENLGKQHQNLIEPEDLDFDANDFRDSDLVQEFSKQKILVSKRESQMSATKTDALEMSKAADDIFSQYLRELTMAPLQLKKHQSDLQNKQLMDQIKLQINKVAQNEEKFLAEAQQHQHLSVASPLQKMHLLSPQLRGGGPSSISMASSHAGPADELDYKKLANQVRRISQIHSNQLQKQIQRQQLQQQTLKKNATRNSIIEDHDDESNSVQDMGTMTKIPLKFSTFKMDPKKSPTNKQTNKRKQSHLKLIKEASDSSQDNSNLEDDMQDDAKRNQLQLPSRSVPQLQKASSSLKAGLTENPDFSFLFKLTSGINVMEAQELDKSKQIIPEEKKADEEKKDFSLKLEAVQGIRKISSSQNKDSKQFTEKLKRNIQIQNLSKTSVRFFSPQHAGANFDHSLKELEVETSTSDDQEKLQQINKLRNQLFDELIETVDSRLRESILSQQTLFPHSTLNKTSGQFFSSRAFSQQSVMPSNNQQFQQRSGSNRSLNQEQKKKKKPRLRTFKVGQNSSQFNISNLPYIKHDADILQHQSYQFKIIKDELKVLSDKIIEFKTQLTYKYSFKSLVVFQTMGEEVKVRFNSQFEELIGFVIEIITTILLKFGSEPQKIGLKNYAAMMNQELQVKNEIQTFKENQTLFIEISDMFKKAYDAYYIMTKMLGFGQLPYDGIKKLQQYVCRSRLSCKELSTDFRYQEELLNREFQKEKTYIESMLLRGEDLYKYQYRGKLDQQTLKQIKAEDTRSSYLHTFLEQQSVAYARKLQKIQQEQENHLAQQEKKKKEKEEQELKEKELQDDPNYFFTQIIKPLNSQQDTKQITNKKKQIPKKSKTIDEDYDDGNGQGNDTEKKPQRGKIKYNVESKLKTQPQFSGDAALQLKLQIKEVMKNLRNMANNKAAHGLIGITKEKEKLQDVQVAKREPDNFISHEAREYIHNSIQKNKHNLVGFLHPAQLEKMIFLENEEEEKIRQQQARMVFYQKKKGNEQRGVHSQGDIIALKEVEKAVRVGLNNCKETKKIQTLSQSLRDIHTMTQPQPLKVKVKKPKQISSNDDEDNN